MPNEQDTHFDVRCIEHHLRRRVVTPADHAKRQKGLKDLADMAETAETLFTPHFEMRREPEGTEDEGSA
jgi:hypothetical protein